MDKKNIEVLREELYEALELDPPNSEEILALSQKLDILILQYSKKIIAEQNKLKNQIDKSGRDRCTCIDEH